MASADLSGSVRVHGEDATYRRSRGIRLGLPTQLARILRTVRVMVTPRGWTLTTRLPDGVVVRGTNRPGYGGRGIYLWRDEIQPEFSRFTTYLPAGGTFVDVGASTGIYTMRAARHVGSQGTVLAIEPVPEICSMLWRNIEANGFRNVRCRSFCLGDQTGEGTLWLGGNPNAASIVRPRPGDRNVSVFIASLDDLIRWEKLERLDYMKVYAGAATREIISGGLDAIRRFRPIVQMQVVPGTVLHGYVGYAAPSSESGMFFPIERQISPPEGWRRLTCE